MGGDSPWPPSHLTLPCLSTWISPLLLRTSVFCWFPSSSLTSRGQRAPGHSLPTHTPKGQLNTSPRVCEGAAPAQPCRTHPPTCSGQTPTVILDALFSSTPTPNPPTNQTCRLFKTYHEAVPSYHSTQTARACDIFPTQETFFTKVKSRRSKRDSKSANI